MRKTPPAVETASEDEEVFELEDEEEPIPLEEEVASEEDSSFAPDGESLEIEVQGAVETGDAVGEEEEIFELELKPRAEAPEAAPAKAAAPKAAAQDNRKSRRFDVSLDVEFRTELDFVREHAANISNGGLFIQTTQRPPLNTEVEVRVRLPNGDVLESRARVAHHYDTPSARGVGLAFANEAPDFQAALDGYLASLAGPV